MYKPLISIIIPTLNSEATIAIALNSIINQTYKNWEIIILDGLSQDRTLDVVESHQREISNIRIISKTDKGIYDAMNKGIKIARGEWLYFMGSDDSFYESTTLEQFLRIDNLNNFDVVYGNVYSSRFNGFYAGEFDYLKLTEKNICHQAIIFNRSVFKKIGKFNLKYKAHADWDHNIRWFYSDKICCKYTQMIIANYADGGFSSVQGDEIFRIDKYYLFLKKGMGKLSYSELFKMCNVLLNFTKREKQHFNHITLRLYKYQLRANRKFNRFFNNNDN